MNPKINFIFNEVSNKICKDVKCWLQQYELVWPAETSARRQREVELINILRGLIGLFLKPQFSKAETIYIFEGLRNKAYMKLFDAKSVVIVGSHIERNYAKSNGHKFCWSFPIEAAVHSKIHFDWSILINRQIEIWIKKLSKHKRVIFFCMKTLAL